MLLDWTLCKVMREGFVMLTKLWNRHCSRSTNHLIISSTHFCQWLRVIFRSSNALIISLSAFLPDFFLLNSSHLYQPTTRHFTVFLQRSWCCTSNHVGIKLLTRVWQVWEAVPLKCKADISGSNNDSFFSFLFSKWMPVWVLSGTKFQTCCSANSRVLVLRLNRPEVQYPLKCIHNSHKLKQLYFL